MPRFVLIFAALWLIAAVVGFSRDGFLVQQCLQQHTIDTCYSAIK